MKGVNIAIVSFLLSIFVTAQDIQKSNAYYLAAIRENNLIGWSLFGGGLVLITAGALNDSDDYGVAKVVLIAGGVAACLVSIPFFTSAARDKKKLVAIGLKNETLSMPGGEQKSVFPLAGTHQIAAIKNSRQFLKTIPAVSFKIKF